MFNFLGFLFLFILFILFFGVTIIGGILRTLFGFRKRPSSSRYTRPSDSYSESAREDSRKNTYDNTGKQKKIFDKDEGEYVEFEEIKDDSR